MDFVYSRNYFADIGQHVFPIEKYRLIFERLQKEANLTDDRIVEPTPATREQLLRVHTEEYLADLENLQLTARTLYSELPLTREIIRMFILLTGGTIKTVELALEKGIAVHIGGGFHHAFAAKAEGFCYLNDLAIAVCEMQAQGKIKKAMVIDCDLHQGNGTAKIFENDASIYTFSIHQFDLYPIKEKSDLDIHLPNGVQDDEYLSHLKINLPQIIDRFKPDLLVYQAGADPYKHDQLGNLSISIAGLAERDRLIYHWAGERRVPIAVTLGGGYAYDTNDTVQIHFNTCCEAISAMQSR